MLLPLFVGGLATFLLQPAFASPLEQRTTLPSSAASKHLRPVFQRRDPQGFAQGQPSDGKGKGGPILGIFYNIVKRVMQN